MKNSEIQEKAEAERKEARRLAYEVKAARDIFDASNLQDWAAFERLSILAALESLAISRWLVLLDQVNA